MCTNCNCNVPYTVQDLKMEFLNDTGCRAENKTDMYIEWLEEKIIDNRNYENCVTKANIEIETELMNRKKAIGEVC